MPSKWILLLIVVLLFTGCQPPNSVKDTLFGAQLTAENAVTDSQKAATGTLWATFPDGATDEYKVPILEKRVKSLLDQMSSIDKNLTSILYYYRVSSMNPFQDTTPPTE